MGRIIVRRKTQPKEPYELPGLKCKVYTPEELAYVYYRNLPRLETEILDERLTEWLEDQNLPGLAAELSDYLEEETADLAGFVEKVLSGISFYEEEEIQAAVAALGKWNQEDPCLRKKEKTDYLLEEGKVQEALAGYDQLVREGQDLSDAFLSQVYHNRGVCLASMFLFEEAAGSFGRAWKLSGAPDSKELYMLSLRMSLSKEAYVNRIAEEKLGEEDAVALEEKLLEILQEEENCANRKRFREIKKQKELGNQAYYTEGLDRLVEDLKKSWRKQYGDF
jgi:hypothetical protein